MTAGLTIVVDVGNSAAKVAEIGNDVVRQNSDAEPAPIPFARVDLREPEWTSRLVLHHRSRVTDVPLGAAAAVRWVVASVNGPASDALRRHVAGQWPQDEWFEVGHADVPLPSQLRNPSAVGIDRLLGASEAWRLASAAAARLRTTGTPETGRGSEVGHAGEVADEVPLVITIDAGSAVTVDLIRGGVFVGGAILPGLRLQLASLTQGTDRLPAVNHRAGRPLEIPGRDTEAAMQTGVMLGIAGGIDRLIERYSAESPGVPCVFLTGGDAAALQPLLSHAVNRRDDLVLAGIAAAAVAPGYHGVSNHSR